MNRPTDTTTWLSELTRRVAALASAADDLKALGAAPPPEPLDDLDDISRFRLQLGVRVEPTRADDMRDAAARLVEGVGKRLAGVRDTIQAVAAAESNLAGVAKGVESELLDTERRLANMAERGVAAFVSRVALEKLNPFCVVAASVGVLVIIKNLPEGHALRRLLPAGECFRHNYHGPVLLWPEAQAQADWTTTAAVAEATRRLREPQAREEAAAAQAQEEQIAARREEIRNMDISRLTAKAKA